MFPPAFSSSPGSNDTQEFEQLISDAITAIKHGDLNLGKKLLDQAAADNRADARVWIWLSATTDDLHERRTYLETALAIEPSNMTARRGLSMVIEKLDQARLDLPMEAPVPAGSTFPQEPSLKMVLCPNCGASIAYGPHDAHLVCKFCGFTRKVDESLSDESSGQELDAVLPDTAAQHWAESQSRLTCEQCGVVILLPGGQTVESCPYCASTRFISSPSLLETTDPQLIGLFKVDPAKAAGSVKSWLGKGLLSPDDLALRHAGMQLHPAYYPFWLFSGKVEIPWFCDVNTGSGGAAHWEAHTGSKLEEFSNVLVPGLRNMPFEEAASIEPFKLGDLLEFAPEHLAGMLALTCDHPLADASSSACAMLVKKAQPKMANAVETTHPKRNFKLGAGKWSGLTYKLALLPIYIGNYPFQGKRFRLLVNGQTGRVGGAKPRDPLKAAMFIAAGLLLLVIAIIVFIVLRQLLAG